MSKKLIYMLLALSLGLNLGVITTTLIQNRRSVSHHPLPRPERDGHPDHQAPDDPAKLVERHLQGITNHLDLDKTQQRAIREVMERHAPRLVELQHDVARRSRQLTEIFSAPDFDLQEFERLAEELSAARQRLDNLSVEMLMAEAQVLTPEQRIKFAQVALSVHSKPPNPRGPGGAPPGGPPAGGRRPR